MFGDVVASFYPVAMRRLNLNYFCYSFMQMTVGIYVLLCMHLYRFVCKCVHSSTTSTHIPSLYVCVCLYVCVSYESSRFGPSGDDKAIKLCVSHINCFDLFFFLSDSWLDGNKGRFTQLERVLKSAKHQEMASEEINSGTCLSSTGSEHTSLFPQVYYPFF